MSQIPENQSNNADSSAENKTRAGDASAADMKKRRDDLNSTVKGLISESKITYSNLERLRNGLKQKKGLRDAENSIIQKLKAERDRLNEELKQERAKLNALRDDLKQIKNTSSSDPKRLEKEIERLEWEVQTKHLNAKAEDALWARINALRCELKSMGAYVRKKEDVKGVRRAVRKLERQAREIHRQVIEHSELSEKHHAELLLVFEELKKMDVLLPEMAKKIMDARTEADRAHEGYLQSIGATQKNRREKEDAERKEIKEKADELLREFKQGKKISLEELMIIQAGEK